MVMNDKRECDGEIFIVVSEGNGGGDGKHKQ